jgi:galactose mutarotase-like enzyme
VNVLSEHAPSGYRHLVIENDVFKAVVLPDKGADIYQLFYKPKGVDVLAKTPWGLKRPGLGVPSSFQSASAWLEVYPGGSQEIFPNGGDACVYKGAELGFHGEASMTTWNFELAADRGEVQLSTRLARSPFAIRRTMRAKPGGAALVIDEAITNESDEPMAYMWGHHPAFGDVLMGEGCRIDHGARLIRADQRYDSPSNPMAPGQVYEWPLVDRDGSQTDLSRFPPPGQPRDAFGYLQEFNAGWYGVTNTDLGFGVGMVWPREIFPYAWFWQEISASSGYPWYRTMRTTAIEPFTSWPGHGLLEAIAHQTHRTLEPGGTVSATLQFVFYESTRGISGIADDGSVVQR